MPRIIVVLDGKQCILFSKKASIMKVLSGPNCDNEYLVPIILRQQMHNKSLPLSIPFIFVAKDGSVR